MFFTVQHTDSKKKHNTHTRTKQTNLQNEILTKHSLIIDVLYAVPHASREGADQNVEVEEERDPGRGLVFRHGCDDGYVNFGVARIPQRVVTSAPRSDVTWELDTDLDISLDFKSGRERIEANNMHSLMLDESQIGQHKSSIQLNPGK